MNVLKAIGSFIGYTIGTVWGLAIFIIIFLGVPLLAINIIKNFIELF